MDDVYARYRESLKLGHQEAAEGRFAEALRHYQSAADVAADRALPYISMGGMHMRLGRPREALAAYERALEAEPGNIDALGGRAAALLAVGKRDEASRVTQQIAEIRRAAERGGPVGAPPADATSTSTADVMHAAGEQALRAGQRESAIDAFLGESREHASAGHLDAALDASMAALSIAPGVARIHLELARLYFKRGWADKGVERALLLDRLLHMEPNADVRAALARLAADNVSVDDRLASLAAPADPQG